MSEQHGEPTPFFSDGAAKRERIVARFEEAWQRGERPLIDDYLAGEGDERQAILMELVRVDLERRLKAGEQVQVEEYLQRYPDLGREDERVIELIASECSQRRRGDPDLTIEEYLRRFPQYQAALAHRLAIEAPARPQQIGRYRVEKLLGEGGFGRVYLAYDDQLQRRVAVKVPCATLVPRPEDAEAYLVEARTVASLDHPNIVPVHDVGSTSEHPCYIVSKYVEGTDLAARIRDDRPSHAEAAQLTATVAEALHYAHTRGLVHRDVKPGNILIDAQGKPFVADFGLALREQDIGRGPRYAGTPAYMSPEQARGEGHRVDGRSDIFSLGVVFYELLTGRTPYRADRRSQLIEEIKTYEPRPPRQLDDRIPKELERICLKALSKRASDRYTTAMDMAEDLREFLLAAAPVGAAGLEGAGRDAASPTPAAAGVETGAAGDTPPATPGSDRAPIRIVPKGLRAFDEQDADFFLELLPGPHDRNGLPESVRFWKTRIQETDADSTFSVGLIYGPSGCGKSSLVRAGLLPRLGEHVIRVYVEAAADETESRLLARLRQRCAGLPENLNLQQTVAALRQGRAIPIGKKVLIVLDQFEQWLHAKREEQDVELVQALRQCDGARVQCVVMVRDDFWMGVTRFMQDLEIRLLEGENSKAVDLFPLHHARKVLAAFGRSFGSLPEDASQTSQQQKDFLNQAIAALAEDGKVVCVRLGLFAEMMKAKTWTPATLKKAGGAEGVGVAFLEETFSASTAPPECRLHQKAARAVLKTLLPESGTEIRAQMRRYDDLLDASGYAGRTAAFEELIGILDQETRLITPTDPEGAAADEDSTVQVKAGGKYYQLTHDYLVPSLRNWLTRKQRETRRGRAELRLAERSAAWTVKPENRHLPAWWELLHIRCFTKKKDWTEPQRRMMRRATTHHAIRATTGAVLLAFLTWLGYHIFGSVQAAGLVRALKNAEVAGVAEIIDDLGPYRRWADRLLKEILADPKADGTQRLYASLALLPVDPSQLDYLKRRLFTASAEEAPVLRIELGSYKDNLSEDLWRILERPTKDEERQCLAAASALALYDPQSKRWEGVAARVADRLVSVNPVDLGQWMRLLRPVRESLTGPLSLIYRNDDGKRSQSEQSLATSVLEDYVADKPEVLADLVMDAGPPQFLALYPKLAARRDKAIELLSGELEAKPSPRWDDAALDPSWKTVDASVQRQFGAADGLIAERFAFCQTMPLDELVKVAETLRKSGYRPVRCRPYATGGRAQAAAVWTRDGRDWRIASGKDVEEVRQEDESLRGQHFMPVDVAGYVAEQHGEQVERFAAVWVQRSNDKGDARMYVAVAYDDHKTVYGEIEKEGFGYQHALQAFRALDGEVKYCGVKSTQEVAEESFSWNMAPASYEEREHLDKILWDVNVSQAGKTASTQERYAKQLAAADDELNAQPDNLSGRFARAQANYYLGNDDKAKEDLDFVIEKLPSFATAYQLRAVVHSRTGKAKEAKKDLAEFKALNPSASSQAYLDAVVAAHLGEDGEGMKRLEEALAAHSTETGFLYDAACAYALAGGAYAEKDADKTASEKQKGDLRSAVSAGSETRAEPRTRAEPSSGMGSKSKLCADRSVALLKQAVEKGHNNYAWMETDPDLDAVREHPAFRVLLKQGQLDRRYAAVWQVSRNFEAKEISGLPPKEHLERCRQLMKERYRPAAISVAAISGAQLLVTASVWHRPLVRDDAKEKLAQRQANAAVGLLRMGNADRAWPLFQRRPDQPDPRLRTWLIHKVKPLEVDVTTIIERLGQENQASARMALILSLGEYEAIPAAERRRLTDTLCDLYRDDAAPGVHGACEWLLRRWHSTDKLDEIDRLLATGKVEGERRWYLNKQGQTFAVLPGPVEFLMGSPGAEEGQYARENLHRRLIPRSFAIATKEVTVDQFQAFLRENPTIRHNYTKQYSPERTTPQTEVSWYQAAAYCRWLSEREEIPDDQMCYPSIEQIKDGLRLPEGYLARTGYRLPTEAEWEYACRAGASTSQCYGQSEELLPQYAWYSDTSNNRAWPVGSLKPNDFGLFDMHGNVHEWCEETHLSYPPGAKDAPREDSEDRRAVTDRVSLVVRGGSFLSTARRARHVRSAYRSLNQPDNRNVYDGFRVARTYR